MTRYADQIVAAHQAANTLRRAGKPIWRGTIDLSDILGRVVKHEDYPDTRDGIMALYDQVRERIIDSVPADLRNEDELECQDLCTVIGRLESPPAPGDDPQDEMNSIMGALYDWADSTEGRFWVYATRGPRMDALMASQKEEASEVEAAVSRRGTSPSI